MKPILLRRIFLAALIVLSGCGLTPYQRFADYASAARADLYSPEMTARICAAGADTAECRK